MDADTLALLGAALGSRRVASEVLERAGSVRRALEVSGSELTARFRVNAPRARVWEAVRRLHHRASFEAAVRGTPLETPQAVHAAVAPLFERLRREELYVLPVDAKLQLVCRPVRIGQGGPHTVSFSPRRVFEVLLREEAAGAFLAHNHPSGDPTPSLEDRRLTERLAQIGSELGLRILDHLVIGRGRAMSVSNGNEVRA
jgi:DNA repair protein RadC